MLCDFLSCSGLWEGRRTCPGQVQSLGEIRESVRSETWKIGFLSTSQSLAQLGNGRPARSVFNHYTFILCIL